jgi:hypothetical protein
MLKLGINIIAFAKAGVVNSPDTALLQMSLKELQHFSLYGLRWGIY